MQRPVIVTPPHQPMTTISADPSGPSPASDRGNSNRRRPWLAALLSALSPGLGQLYAGSPGRAAVVAVAVCAAVVALPLLAVSGPPTVLLAMTPVIGVLAMMVWYIHDAWRTARRASSPSRQRWFNRWYVYLGLGLALNVGILEPIRGIVRRDLIQAYHIPSGAMEPALLIGDVLYADKRGRATRPARGDVVIYESLETPGLLAAKRVVGVPGDTLAMYGGTLTRNGARIDERYVQLVPALAQPEAAIQEQMRHWQLEHVLPSEREQYAPTASDWGPLVVPHDNYFLLGDNRNWSYDSRYTGFVPAAQIRGRPHLIYWSYDPGEGTPLAWLTRVRFGRIGLGVPGDDGAPAR